MHDNKEKVSSLRNEHLQNHTDHGNMKLKQNMLEALFRPGSVCRKTKILMFQVEVPSSGLGQQGSVRAEKAERAMGRTIYMSVIE